MRGNPSKRLTILSDAEKDALYGLPDFDDFQRVEFFAMTDAERSLAMRRRGLEEQIYCLLQIGYFKAKQAFFQFSLNEAPPDDVAFLMQRYERLRECLDRMQSTALAVYPKRLQRGVSLSMIPVFEWQDENKQTLKKYRVQVAPQLVDLFGDVHYTQVEWSQRLSLPVGIATWMHGYYASHREPFPVKLDTLKKGAGITTESASRVRQLIESALTKR